METEVTIACAIRGVVNSVVALKVVLSIGYCWGYTPNGGDRVCLVPLYISQYVIVNVFQSLTPHLGVTTKVTTLSGHRDYCNHTDTRPPPI